MSACPFLPQYWGERRAVFRITSWIGFQNDVSGRALAALECMTRRLALILAVVIAAVLAAVWFHGRSSDSDPDPDALAATIGAKSCEKTGFYLESQLSGDKARIYDCYRDYHWLCVTQEGNLPRDETESVTLLFKDAFAENKPTCAH